jgi:hypothetical protein
VNSDDFLRRLNLRDSDKETLIQRTSVGSSRNVNLTLKYRYRADLDYTVQQRAESSARASQALPFQVEAPVIHGD